MRDLRVFPNAERFLDSHKNLAAQLLSVCDSLAEDPFVDGETKIAFLVPPWVFRVWEHDGLWIVYHLDHADCVKIYNMGDRQIAKPNWR